MVQTVELGQQIRGCFKRVRLDPRVSRLFCFHGGQGYHDQVVRPSSRSYKSIYGHQFGRRLSQPGPHTLISSKPWVRFARTSTNTTINAARRTSLLTASSYIVMSGPKDEEVLGSDSIRKPPAKHANQLRKRPNNATTWLGKTPTGQRAVVAFGSNLGDRVQHIENALASMRAAGLRIIKLSHLYETKPMYYDDQDSFLNGVVLIETILPALELLNVLQRIEKEQGRVRNIDKGPRTLDLDIILYGLERFDHERLQVPHPRMLEREFVLRPLSDVLKHSFLFPAPHSSSEHGQIATTTVRGALQNVPRDGSMRGVTVFGPRYPLIQANDPGQETLIMSILNITPDSFSDGGKLSPTNVEQIVATAKSQIASGATVLDVGGQSTRPDATMISSQDELGRLLPALRAVRTIPEVANGRIVVSLDTFYSDVARPCIAEGLIDIVNDISAGQLDPQMLATVAESRKSIVLMHSRGEPQTMNTLATYLPKGVVYQVARELAYRVDEALGAGIPPWRIILDPGIGFAKKLQHNLALLKTGTEGITSFFPDDLKNYPWLVGTSRKSFIGTITGVKSAEERTWGTAACITAAISGGANVVRVHDVDEMSKVAKMADALYRVIKPNRPGYKHKTADESIRQDMEANSLQAVEQRSEDVSSTRGESGNEVQIRKIPAKLSTPPCPRTFDTNLEATKDKNGRDPDQVEEELPATRIPRHEQGGLSPVSDLAPLPGR